MGKASTSSPTTPILQYSNTPCPEHGSRGKKINPIVLAQEIIKFRKEKHLYGYNYAVKVRLGHAEIQDLTAIADILAAIEELGYTIVRKAN